MNLRFATVQIRDTAERFLGTGFFVQNQRILTCRHVIEKYMEGGTGLKVVIHWLGERRLASTFTIHESRDAALIDFSHPFSVDPLILDWAQFTASEGKRVTISGFAHPEVYELEHLTRHIRGYAQDYDLSVLDYPVDSGFSGSPVICGDLVVGLTVAADATRTLMVPVTSLKTFAPPNSSSGAGCVLDVGSIADVPEWGAPAEVKFTVTNTGDRITKVSSITVNVLQRDRIWEPHHFLPGAIVEEYELNVTLDANIDRYELLSASHILKPGETDGFRLKVDSPDGWRYKIDIRVAVNEIGNSVKHELMIGPFELNFRLRSSSSLLEAVREAKRMRG